MKLKLFKSGNSLATRIPLNIANELDIKEGSLLDVSYSKSGITLKPIRKKKYQLDDLLSKINKSNLHTEISTHSNVGSEIID